ncbi:4Fe-4S dicluster domain-containing protein [Carboxylicivirga sp. RSCT41]|uniref:4Fe-4S dicluster domain-containing protein n=1 Tax=Carboxylicivirga agarovorans TaxID=3417570 RepID=UPI003D33DF1F
MDQLIFISILIITAAALLYSFWKIKTNFDKTRSTAFYGQWVKRTQLTLQVAFGQTKILRKPVIGLMHALVFWGFMVITIGSLEMVIDGIIGSHRLFGAWGMVYDIISASGDIFALIVLVGIIAFLFRRLVMRIKRFKGIELSRKNKTDANIALSFIMLLMLSLIGLNVYETVQFGANAIGTYPFSGWLVNTLHPAKSAGLYAFFWWMHIVLIFVFANYLPYSKHFHVFMSLPNVFFSNLKPLTHLPMMPEVKKEVDLMMSDNPYAESDGPASSRFGVKDVEDITWKNYMDALTCTQCGRCTEVCPANITGKLLSPRKLFVDIRQRMDEKAGLSAEDAKALVGDYITPEELWACTSCNACAQECPLNISHPNLIMDMRRYLVLEEGQAPEELNAMFANIENNGAPWKYSPEDRLKWTEG